MIYDYARPLIGVFFLIAVVNLLVIPESHKKIITFYMHFLIIFIILNPLIRIMDNEVGSRIDSIIFISEEDFNKEIQYHQDRMEGDLKEFTHSETDSKVNAAADICQIRVTGVDLDDSLLIIEMAENSVADQNCMLVELGIGRDEVKFERGGR